MILGLAPAAHGVIVQAEFLQGDKSAEFLFKCLHHAGLANQPNSRSEMIFKLKGYVTAAVKCVPPGDKPTAEEKANCEEFLDLEFKILKNIKSCWDLVKLDLMHV